ncbi:AraC family transcriptional regulator [Flavobacterium sp. UMI-01]|uniref:helix-turn-helix domain-containing protein n=1 Tax=Flavobacterium sp. UMI-01 TaxID=1441053 RepID=UPI001C7D0549|nr:helix-turn-helix domain-containing protein [Flavobacterium sp. UMI-01]GIZ07579.1 transcriptional regulator [Flavobacterium sp. UMI-01]
MNSDPSIKNLSLTDLVEIIGDNPQEENGLHIHFSKSRFKEIPIGYPFRANAFSFILVIKGHIRVQLNLLNYTINALEIIAINPQTVIHIQEISKNLEILNISFNIDYILKNAINKNELDSIDFFTARSIPKIKLSEFDLKTFIDISKIIETHNTIGNTKPFNIEIIKHGFKLLIYYYGSLLKTKYPTLEVHLTRQEKLALRFIKLLNENIKQERSVQFYADILCVTPGYLSKVLKSLSQKNASQLIDEAVIMEAKLLLQNQTLSILEVATELQFSDQSFFGKYFKKHTGFSPSKYRETAFEKSNSDQ